MATAAETFVMAGKDSLWAAAERCHEALSSAGIPHAIVGGMAVCLHGYQRTTVDVELIATHRLDGEFAARLHKAVRKTYRRLARNARGEA